MQRRAYLLLILLLLMMTAVASWLLLYTRPQPSQVELAVQPLAVRTAVVQRGELHTTITERGRLVPAREAKLLFQVEGMVTRRHVVPGQSVAAQELLLEIEDSMQRSAVQRVKARLEIVAQATVRDRKLLHIVEQQVQLLAEEVQRQEALQQDSLSSLDRLQQAQRELLVAKSEQERLKHEITVSAQNKQQLQADLIVAEQQLAYCHILAPFAAQVNEITVQVGDNAIPGRQAVHLVTADELDVLVSVRSSDMYALQLGNSGEVVATANLPARKVIVKELQLVPDARTYTHLLRLHLLDSTGFIAGQVVDLRLPGRHWQDMLLVPYEALWQEEGRFYLYIVDETDSLRHAVVKLLASDGDTAAIEGVAPGQEIVLDVGQSILPGQVIQRINNI